MARQLSTTIKGDNTILGNFVLQIAESGNGRQQVSNTKNATFDIQEGVKYVMAIEVAGDDAGAKFSIEITGASKAVYPTQEIVFVGHRDFILARITG
ncbi:MAG TPA: hypothetical protein DEG76_08450 [Pseudohongiella sp.]|nr:hypothetical protein [Pseudohongiella sp.]HBX37293.1 hypothetical protein [Pseudohongiella sp.]|tara:strand:- start:1186 stop:1476 length:291 start_codon:yes stop_codon:yes gene_type:complete